MRYRLHHFAPLFLAVLVSLSGAQSQSTPEGRYQPAADARAEVVFHHARFTVLTPELVRMEWAADDKFEDRASFVFLNRHLDVPQFTHTEAGDKLTLRTSALELTYNASGKGEFSPTNLHVTFTLNGKPVEWHPGLVDTENLQGTTRTLDGALGDKTKEPIEPGLLSRSGWALVDDSARPLFDSADFSFTEGEKSPLPWVQLRSKSPRQDLYLFAYGHNYTKALGDYVKLAGRIPLPPRFAFGAWWSRYWAYSDQELDELIKGFHDNNVPLDVFVIDMDWHLNDKQLAARGEKDQSGEGLGWSGYTWNPELFPYPEEFLSKLHREGLKTTLNLHPASGVQPWEAAYPAMAKAMGIDPATRKYVPFDITDKKFATNYMALLHHPLEHQGIDFWWLDYQQEQRTNLEGVMPTWWLNYVHFTDQQREGKRPLLFHRWGGLGNHRYQIGFSGDTFSVWESLAFQPWFTATAANVGYAYWSHDIGGHMPGEVEPELYTRWVQFGAYSPILRTHTTKNPSSERRIWAYPEPYSSVLRSTFQQRYALEPYLYTEARSTYDSGVAFLRPLYYEWPEQNEAYSARNEYLFGSQMLVAPVITPADKTSQLATEKVFIPAGEWIEQPTGKHLTGPATFERTFSIEQTPVYLRAGAIVPMQPAMSYTGEKPVDPLIINQWPMAAGATSSYTLYEDDGHAVDYQNGGFARTPISATQTADSLTLTIHPVEGSYPGMAAERGYELRLPADWPPAAVAINGNALAQSTSSQPTGWSYDGSTLTTIIPIPRTAVSSTITVTIRRDPALIARRAELDGLPGAFTRLRASYDALQRCWPIAAPSDALIHAMQTPDRLSYHPEKAATEITDFARNFATFSGELNALSATFNQSLEDYIKERATSDWTQLNLPLEKQRRIETFSRARAVAAVAGK